MLPDPTDRDSYRAQQIAAELGLRRETERDLFGYSEAVYGGQDQYRYLLSRRWAVGGTTCTWIMLNPSTATAAADDPTIRRCVGYSRRWGHSALTVLNLFAYRATDPRELQRVAEPVGPHNDEFLQRVCQPGWTVMAAWGVHGRLLDRAEHVVKLLDAAGIDLSCLSVTANGSPRHPLYCRLGLAPQHFHLAAA